jgi:hypothetical protein
MTKRVQCFRVGFLEVTLNHIRHLKMKEEKLFVGTAHIMGAEKGLAMYVGTMPHCLCLGVFSVVIIHILETTGTYSIINQ